MILDAFLPESRALALLIAANGVPVIVAKLACERWSWPLDGGLVLGDGQRLLGAHKTWRGFACGSVAGALTGTFLGLPSWLGAGVAVASLVADAASSAIKRRLRLVPGTEFVGLDQLGEAASPLLLFAQPLALDLSGILIVTATFIALDLATSSLRHQP